MIVIPTTAEWIDEQTDIVLEMEDKVRAAERRGGDPENLAILRRCLARETERLRRMVERN